MYRRDGVSVYYHLSDQRIADACGLIKDFLQDQHKFNPEIQELLEHQDGMYPVIKDVVCGMRISLSRAGEVIKHDGHTYYFCASGCKQKFESQPTKYKVMEEVMHGNR